MIFGLAAPSSWVKDAPEVPVSDSIFVTKAVSTAAVIEINVASLINVFSPRLSKPSPKEVVHRHGYHNRHQESQYHEQGERHVRGL